MALLHLGCWKVFLPTRWDISDYQHLSQSTLSKSTRTILSIFLSEIANLSKSKELEITSFCTSLSRAALIATSLGEELPEFCNPLAPSLKHAIHGKSWLLSKETSCQVDGRVVNHTAWSWSTLYIPPLIKNGVPACLQSLINCTCFPEPLFIYLGRRS